MSKKRIAVVDRRKGISDKIVFSVAFMIFFLYAVSIVVFFGWAVLTSFKDQSTFIYEPLALPDSFSFVNYKTAYALLEVEGTKLPGLFWNSIWYAGGASFLYIFFHLCTSYVFTKFEFKAKGIMYFFIILYMLIPLYGSQASTYRLIYNLNLTNTPLYLVTFAGGFTGSTFLILSAAWETVDRTYGEAAAIDGAGLWQTYIHLMLPMVFGPALALFVIQFIANWNQYEVFYMYLDKLPNLAYGIYRFSETMKYESNDPVFFAGITLSLIPVLVFFSIFANKIMESISFGSGIKG